MVSTLIKEKPNLRFKEHNEEWKKEKLGKLVEISTGKKDTQNKVEDGLYPFFVRSQTIERINSFSFDGEAILTAGDGVGVGKVFHYINGKFDYHQRVYKLSSFSPSIHSWYLFEYFRLNFIREVTKYTAKTSVDSVRMEMLTEMVIKFPSIEEQTKIATFLSAIDEKIERQQRLLTLWQAYKKGIMQQIFSQKLRFKDDKGVNHPGWRKKSIGDLYDFYPTNSFSRDCFNYKSGKAKCIHYGDIHSKYKSLVDVSYNDSIPFINESIDLSKFKETSYCIDRDIIIADASEDLNDIGKTIELYNISNTKILAGLHTILARVTDNQIAPKFGQYLFSQHDVKMQIRRKAQGISVLGISKTNISEIKVLIPRYEEQTKIATFLSSLDGKIAHIERQLTSFREFKKGLLQQMFV